MRIDWTKLCDLVTKLYPVVKELIAIIVASGVFLATKDAPTTVRACGYAANVGVADFNIFALIAGLYAALRTGGGAVAVIKAVWSFVLSSGLIVLPTKPVQS